MYWSTTNLNQKPVINMATAPYKTCETSMTLQARNFRKEV